MWLVAYVRSNPSLVSASVPAMPALLTRTSSGWFVARKADAAERIEESSETSSVEKGDVEPGMAVAQCLQDRQGPFFGATCEHQACAASRQRLDQGPTDAGIGSGDEEGALLERHRQGGKYFSVSFGQDRDPMPGVVVIPFDVPGRAHGWRLAFS